MLINLDYMYQEEAIYQKEDKNAVEPLIIKQEQYLI